jgi:hypothetical protein
LVDILENILDNFEIPNEININDYNSPLFLDNHYYNSLNQKNYHLNNNIKIEDYFKKDQDNK